MLIFKCWGIFWPSTVVVDWKHCPHRCIYLLRIASVRTFFPPNYSERKITRLARRAYVGRPDVLHARLARGCVVVSELTSAERADAEDARSALLGRGVGPCARTPAAPGHLWINNERRRRRRYVPTASHPPLFTNTTTLNPDKPILRRQWIYRII